jgi:hypothetical protein
LPIGYAMENCNNTFPLCNKGYGGNLCQTCVESDGLQYARSGPNGCSICPSTFGNIIKILAIFIAVVSGLSIMIWMNLSKKKDSQTSIILRIATNYIHVMTAAASLNLDWPEEFDNFLRLLSSIG